MQLRLAPALAIFATACLVSGTFAPAMASDTREDVIDALRATELPAGPMDELNDKELSEVALKSKTVEAKRDTYARALELYIERIGAGKDVDQALIDYERAEIALAAEWKATRKVLEIIKRQDRLAHEWKHHRTLHPDLRNTEHASHHHQGHTTDHNAVENADHHSYNANDQHRDGPQANRSSDIFF